MKIISTTLAYFSPTGTGKRVLQAIGKGLGAPITEVDLTPPDAETRDLPDVSDSLVLCCAPVYGGTIPVEAERRLARLTGDGAPVVLVALYGNRAFDNTLLVMRRVAEASGFQAVAAAAFIGEHSYSTEALPIAHGRPDAADLAKAVEFGQKVAAKLAGVDSPANAVLAAVPGVDAVNVRTKRMGFAPTTDPDVCVLCGTCARVCPTGVVTVTDEVTTDAADCINCMACVKACPTGARVRNAALDKANQSMNEKLVERREPDLYL
jgi:ferredoxin